MPPPIPRVPIAPAPARTDVVAAQGPDDNTGDDPHPEALSEDTRNLEAPDASQLVARMLDLVASEAEALLVGDDADGRLADLNVRTALASWDGLHQPDEAMRHLELAESHPLAPRLRLSAALGVADAAALTAAQTRIDVLPSSPAAIALAIEIAEAWLFRHRKPELAAAVADRILKGEVKATWRPHVIELAALAHAAAGTWSRVVEIRRAALGEASPPEEVAATAALVMDHAGDPAAALALCWAAIERMDGMSVSRDSSPMMTVARGPWLRVIDVAIDAASRAGDVRRLELLDRRAELVATLPMSATEALASRHAVAAELVRDGQHAEAATLWAQLADEPTAAMPAAGRRIATLATAHAAAAANDAKAALAARRRLIDADAKEIVATHAWRALELAIATKDTNLVALAHTAETASGSPIAERWLDLIEHEAPTVATIARFEKRGGLALRWAATIAELLGDQPRALDLWRRCANVDARLGTEHDHLVRILRDGDDDELAEVYASWARTETDPRCAASLQCARGIVDLMRGDFVEAEETLQRAADLDPKDPFCRAALAAVYRAGKRYDQLAKVLADLSKSLVSRDGRASAAREYAELLDQHLGDPAGARAALEQMILDRPDDDQTMLVLARLYDGVQQWTKSIELRQRAVAAAPTPERRAEIWIEIALREERRGDADAALTALDRAVETGARRAEVMREQIRILRQAGRYDKALGIVRGELATDPPLARRMKLQSEQAQLLTALGAEPEAVVASYLDVLSIEPDQTEALAGIEAPARKLGLWDELARAFRGAPQTARNLEVLAEALAKIAEWSELAEVRRRQLELAQTPAEKAQRAAELVHLYEHDLGDLDGAIRMLVVAQANVADETRQKELLRLLRATERWAEMAQVLERELPTVRENQVARQVDILLQLGELRADKLERKPDAVLAYVAVLACLPNNPVAS